MLRNIFSLEYIDDKCWVCILDEVVVSEEIDKIVYGTWWFFVGLFIGSFTWFISVLVSIFLLPIKLSWPIGYCIFYSLFNAIIVFLILCPTKVEKYKAIAAAIGSIIPGSLIPYIIYELFIYFIARP